ncbi:MAG: sigma-70 family RNA polymerase sigma factor [Oscillospiraceae bacterium]|nr:sigma-70 family RNA polymerase sigma factor [Oscillospiraceae bacterium]
MEDSRIVELFWARDEAAISEARGKYGRYCLSVAANILGSGEDAEETLSDALYAAWNAIPPHRPAMLSTFLGKLTRRAALKKVREASAQKRGGGQLALTLEELSECVSGSGSAEEAVEAAELARAVNAFLAALPAQERNIFLCRYWYLDPVADIASRFGCGQSKVKMTLKRTREKLRTHLEKEGYL